jgi:enoyl-[acyl-carrier-protein] reductase (NADH)
MTKDEREKVRDNIVSRIYPNQEWADESLLTEKLLDYCDKLEKRVGKLEEALGRMDEVVHSLASAYKGYLPGEHTHQDADTKTRLAFIEDSILRALNIYRQALAQGEEGV